MGRRLAPRRAAARAGALAATVALLLLLVTPAHAAVPPLPGPVQDVVDTVEGVASSDDPVSEAIDAVDDAIGGATGTDDPIQGTVDDVADAGEDVAEDVGGAVDDAANTVGGTVDEVIDTVDEATGGAIGGNAPGEGGAPGARGPRNRPIGSRATTRFTTGGDRRTAPGRDGRAATERASSRPARATDAGTSALPASGVAPEQQPGLAERLGEAALEATKKLAIPLALTVVVLGYVIAQYWADRRDPKLVFAPIDADHDLLSFQ